MSTNNTTMSEEERERFLEEVNWTVMNRVAPFLVYFSLLMVFGLLGNSVVFAVYYRRFNASVTRTCVLTMSVLDLSTNVIALPVEVLRVRYHATFTADWECKLHWFVLSTLIIFSAYVLVVVAVDRRRLICRRMASRKRSSLQKVKIALGIGLGISVFLSIPRFVIMGHQTLYFSGNEITGTSCGVVDRYEPTAFVKVYNGLLALWFVTMCVTMNVSYGQIAFFLYQHKRKARQAKQKGTNNCAKGENLPAPSTIAITKINLEPSSVHHDSEDINPNDFKPSHFHSEGSEVAFALQQPSCFINPAGPTLRETNHTLGTADGNLVVEDSDDSLDTSTVLTDDTTLNTTEISPSPAAGRQISRTSKTSAGKRRSARRSAGGPQGKKIPARTTLMLAVLSVVFVVNFVPFLVLELMEKLKPALVSGIEENVFLVLTNTQYINSAINPLVYSFCSARFRYECRNLFSSCRRW